MATITPELAARLIEEEANANMVGRSLYGDVGLPEVGGDLVDYLSRLHFSGQPQKAYDLATLEGIPGEEWSALMSQRNAESANTQPWLTNSISGVGNYAAEHPWVYFAPLAIAGATGAFGAGAAGGAGGAAGGAGGAGAVSGALPAAGYSGLSTIPGVADLTVLGSAAGGLGAGAGIGAGLGGAAAGNALAGGSAAQAPLGEGPPEPAAGGAAGAGGGGAAAGAAGGMNWLDWANLGSTVLGIYGAGRAADAQVAGSQAAIDESKRQFDTARGDFLPTIKLGQQSADQLSALNRGDMSSFFTSPDYQFNLAEGQKAIDRSLASRGKALSGQGVREGVRYASGQASNQYGSFVDRLLAAAGLGTTGAAASANAGANSANLVGNANMNAGAARASGYANQYGALQGGIYNRLFKQYLGG